MTRQPLLEVEALQVRFHVDEGIARAVDGISFSVGEGRTLALVGESGCGKSVTALAILRLLPCPPAEIAGGQVRLLGRDLLSLEEKQLREVRGREAAVIFQEPMTALNPVLSIGAQVGEGLVAHGLADRRAAAERAVELLEMVGIPAPAERARAYPHELSGGMRQRAMIAMAIACEPRLLIADEPTTALDTTVQAQVLELLGDLQRRFGMGMLWITHDLGLVAQMADEVAVMYAGELVERASAQKILAAPRHPYTRGLIASVPAIDGPRRRLEPIAGTVPPATDWPEGCRFRTRCPVAESRCADVAPSLREVAEGHAVACHLVS